MKEESDMLMNLLLGLPIMMLCLLFQGILLVLAIRFYVNNQTWVDSPRLGARIPVLAGVMTLLVVGNLVQVGIWATLFFKLGEFTEFDVAMYHSLVNFSTLGYGDIVMSDKWRLLGPLESLNGIIMVGVSTSALMLTIQDTYSSFLKKPKRMK